MLKAVILALLIFIPCCCHKDIQPQPKIQQPIIEQVQTPKLTKVQQMVISKYQWLYFVAYLVFSCIAAWYLQKMGQQDSTLVAIKETLWKRLSWKFKALYRVIKFLRRKKK